jgi:galactose oxidase-like protein/Big-like domain-containing protein
LSGTPPPSQIGQWSAPVSWPIVAVHMTLLPTGNVIAYDGFSAEVNSERIWNPSTGTFTPVPYGRNLFCAGHILLPDGRALIVGGHVSADVGTADTTVFNPSTSTWTREPDMSVTRWYPTATEMGNGKVFVLSGDNIVTGQTGVAPTFRDSSVNSLPEVFDPVSNSWTDLTSSRLTSPLYPQMFQLSDGRLIDVGPDTSTRTITPGTWQWQTLGTSPFDGMSAVMYLPDKIMKAGSWADPDFSGSLAYAAQGRTAVLDMTQSSPAWRETSPMNFARAYENLTLLPDGTVLASGGETASDGVDLTKAVLPAEIWDPTTEKWTQVASLTNGREYHSTALLLPDGRVLMAGGGQLPGSGATDQTNAEIYSPPYLFKGSRPTITGTPGTIQYGSSFTVQTPDAASVTKVAVIRTPSVTHAFDQNQRYIPLSFTAGSGQLTVQAPANGNTAPPGYYMLFILNGSGVPSVASFVRFPAPWEDLQPPTAPTGLTATAGTGSIALSWTAATDNIGVTKYDIHRSTTSGFTPSASNQIGTSTTTSYTDTAVSSGTYYYLVKAEDAAGNVGPASNQASATITISDTTPPTVSITAPANGATVSGTSVSVTANASDNIGVAGVQFKLDGANLGAEDTASPYAITWDTTATSNGTHTLTAVARDGAGNTTTSSAVNVTVSNSTTKVLLGDQAIESMTDYNDAGLAEASQGTAIASGTLSKLSVYIDGSNLSTQVLVGVYTDNAGHPGTLLSTGTLNAPAAGLWNTVNMTAASLTTGTTYWIALLSPVGAGQVKFRDRTGVSSSNPKTEASSSKTLTALPATWASGAVYTDGPFSAYGSG